MFSIAGKVVGLTLSYVILTLAYVRRTISVGTMIVKVSAKRLGHFAATVLAYVGGALALVLQTGWAAILVPLVYAVRRMASVRSQA